MSHPWGMDHIFCLMFELLIPGGREPGCGWSTDFPKALGYPGGTLSLEDSSHQDGRAEDPLGSEPRAWPRSLGDAS